MFKSFFKKFKEENIQTQELQSNEISQTETTETKENKGFFSFFKKEKLLDKFKKGLSKTKEKLAESFAELFEVDKIVDLQTLEELEEKLILADLGVKTTLDLLEPFKNKVIKGEPLTTKQLKSFLKNQLLSCLLYTSPSPRDGLLSRMPSSA